MTIYVIYGGMDCDCVHYANRTTFESVSEYLAWDEIERLEAEGPFYSYEVSKSDWDLQNYLPLSRDLALEAFEEGHPHIVYV